MTKLPLVSILILFFLSLSFVYLTQAQTEDTLVIKSDFGDYKYFVPEGQAGQPPNLYENMKRAEIAFYNWTESNGDVFGVGFGVIEFFKSAHAEEYLNKIKKALSSGDTDIRVDGGNTRHYKENMFYYVERNDNIGRSPGWIWQSGVYLVFGFGPLNPPESVRKNIHDISQPYPEVPEVMLDAYIEKYPVNYFECPPYQTPSQGGYTYAPDYDENGCISGYHQGDDTSTPLESPPEQFQKIEHESISEAFPSPTPQTYPTQDPIDDFTSHQNPPYPNYPTPSQYYPTPQLKYPQPVPPEPTPVLVSGDIIKENTQEADQGKIIQAAIQLVNIKILFQELKNSIEDIANYYYNSGNQEKYNLWFSVIEMFETAINKVDQIVQDLKSTKNLDTTGTEIKKLISYVSQIADKILEAI